MFAAIRVDQPLTNLCTNLIPKCALYEKKTLFFQSIYRNIQNMEIFSPLLAFIIFKERNRSL